MTLKEPELLGSPQRYILRAWTWSENAFGVMLVTGVCCTQDGDQIRLVSTEWTKPGRGGQRQQVSVILAGRLFFFFLSLSFFFSL